MNHKTEALDKQQGPNKRWIIMTAVFYRYVHDIG